MKALSILLVIISLNLKAQEYPRKIDLKVDMVSPKPNSVVKSPALIDFTFRVTNQGPDTLIIEDSILYTPNHSFYFESDEAYRFHRITSTILPGDSFDITDTMSVNHNKSTHLFHIWFLYPPSAISWHTNRPIQAEFHDEKEDNRARVTLTHVGNTASTDELESAKQLSVFPNPVSANSLLAIISSYPIKSIELLNDLGQLVKSEATNNEKNIQLGLEGIKPGSYVVLLHTANGVLRKKLIVL